MGLVPIGPPPAPRPKAETWTCTHCDSINNIDQNRCNECNAPKKIK